ncbi:MAG: hypothetical protein ACKVQA_03970 [Burkholderiales bacterium]
MEQFFVIIESHSTAMLVLLLCLAVLLFSVQWLMWLFAVGRFQKPEDRVTPGKPQNLTYLVTDGLVKIINDFRHLLALLIVLIFGVTLSWALYQAGANISNIKEVLQSVVATLGGLVGSIIGYYFGEAAAKRSPEDTPVGDGASQAIPQDMPPAGPSPSIKEVQPPTDIKG